MPPTYTDQRQLLAALADPGSLAVIQQLLYEPTSKARLIAGLARVDVSKSTAYVALGNLELLNVLTPGTDAKILELTDPSGMEAILDRLDDYIATMLSARMRVASAHRNRRRARTRPPDLVDFTRVSEAARAPVSLPGGIVSLVRDELVGRAREAQVHFVDGTESATPETPIDRAASFDPKANEIHINLQWSHLQEQYAYWQRVYAHQPDYYRATIREFVLNQVLERIASAILGAIGQASRGQQRPFPTELAALTSPEALTTAAYLAATDFVELKKRLAQKLGAGDPEALALKPF